MSERRVNLALSPEEGLILFDWLARFNKTNDGLFADQSEQRVLWNVEAMLESALPEVLDAKYTELVEQARSRVRDDTSTI